jgi:hypothetical protein
MFTNPGFTLGDQLFWIVELFCKTITADPRTRELGPVSIALWTRVRRFQRRFCALYAMWKAGTLPKGRVRAVAEPHSPASAGEGANGVDGAKTPPAVGGEDALARHLRPASLLPRAFRWLQRMLPSGAEVLASGVEGLLVNYPETKQFVAECPQVGRVLRPLARMAGLQVPEWLALPRRRGVSKKDTSPRPSPHSGDGEVVAVHRKRRTAREIAEALMARSERTGKPVDIRKVSSVVWGYIVHTPRDGNCPPPEIGYGGRRWRPPKDYQPPRDED